MLKNLKAPLFLAVIVSSLILKSPAALAAPNCDPPKSEDKMCTVAVVTSIGCVPCQNLKKFLDQLAKDDKSLSFGTYVINSECSNTVVDKARSLGMTLVPFAMVFLNDRAFPGSLKAQFQGFGGGAGIEKAIKEHCSVKPYPQPTPVPAPAA